MKAIQLKYALNTNLLNTFFGVALNRSEAVFFKVEVELSSLKLKWNGLFLKLK